MKKRLLAVLFTVVMSLTVGLFATACKKDPPPATVTYTVTFDKNYDGASAKITEVPVPAGSTVEEPTAPTRTGWTFLGWFDESGNEFVFSTPITGDITLKADWAEDIPPTPTYNVTFTETAGVTYNFTTGLKPTTVDENTVVQFSLKVSPYYVVEDEIVVKANGTAVTPTAGVYSVTVTAHTTITVEGVEAGDTEMGGAGTQVNPYTIGTPAQWLGFVEYVNDDEYEGEEYFALIDNIDFEGYSVPVVEFLFACVLDGQGYKLSNATVDACYEAGATKSLAALFAQAPLSEFYNIEIENITVNVSASTNNVSAAALVAYGMETVVENVHVTGTSSITANASSVTMAAGIVGELYGITGSAFASVTYCTSAANITSTGSSAYAAGIVGAIGGDSVDLFSKQNAYCYAFVAYCAATGRLTSDFAAGGIAAFVQPWVAIQNCYFAGEQDAAVYGGIAALVFEEEIVIANCFSTAIFTEGLFTGAVYGRVIEQAAMVREYEADNYIADCYYAPNGVFTVGDETYTFEEDATEILALLKWNAASWDLTGDLPVPQYYENDDYTATVGITPEKAFTKQTNAGAVTVPAEKQTQSVPLIDPLAFIGTFITGTYDGLDIAANEPSGTWFSAGYYKNGQRLPGAYLITDNTDTEDIVLRFVNYNEVAGEYYFVSAEDGNGYRLVLYNDGTASVAGSNNQTARFGYYYFGTEADEEDDTVVVHVIALVGAPTYVFNPDLNDSDSILPRLSLNKDYGIMVAICHDYAYPNSFLAYSYSDVIGVWANGTTDNYKFNIDRTGTYTNEGALKAFTWDYAYSGTGENAVKTGVTVTFADGTDPVTLTFGDNKFVSGVTEYLKKANPYVGSYVTDVYTNGTLEVSGDEPLDDGKFTVGSTTYKVNASGFIVSEDEETTYYAENSFAGMWYGPAGQGGSYILILGGINLYGVGEAQFGGVTFTYSVKSVDGDTVVLALVEADDPTSTGTVTITLDSSDHETVALMTIDIPDYSIEAFALKLDDVFRGVWYAADGTTYVFQDGEVTIGDATAVAYTYVNGTTITVDSDTITYVAEDAYESLTKGSDTLLRGDMFGVYYYMDSDGNQWSFNGKGIANNGVVRRTVRDSVELYSYTVDATGKAIITDYVPFLEDDETPQVLFEATYDAATALVTVTPYSEGAPVSADAFALGLYNSSISNWVGAWKASNGSAWVNMQIGVMDIDGKFAVSAGTTYADIVSGEYLGNGLNFYNAEGTLIYETGRTSSGVYLLMEAGENSGYPMYKMDAYMGTWFNSQIGILQLDGFGTVGVGGGAYQYGNADNQIFYDLAYQYDDDDDATYLYMEVDETYYYWYEMIIISVDGYVQQGTQLYPYAYYANYYQTLAGQGANAGYVLVLLPLNTRADNLTGMEAYEEDDTQGQGLYFAGNSIRNDVLLGTPGNFIVYYYADLSDEEADPVLYTFKIVSTQGGVYTLTLYALNGTPVYTVTMTYDSTSQTFVINSIAPYEAPETDTEALAA